MALKPHQKVVHDDINFRCTTTGVQGQMVAYVSGNVAVSTDVAAKSAGMLMIDVVTGIHPSNINLTEDTGTIDRARNFQKNETYVSGVVRLLKIGEITTNQVSGTISAGDQLYVTSAGTLGASDLGGELVGHALSGADADGFVKVYLNVP
jgi:hypothetical protein